VRWRHSGRDIAGVCATPVIAGDTLLALHAPGWLVAYALDDGSRRWRAPLEDAWPVALASTGDVALVRAATGTVTAHSTEDGAVRWRHPLGGGRRAGRPYSRAPGGARIALVVAGDQVWTATFDELVGLDLATGALVTRVAAGGEIAAVFECDKGVVAVTVDDEMVGAG
jgi:outer membrane protein assembly factor BamB